MVAVAVKSTQAFIDENPVDLSFVRTPKVKSSAGGMVDGASTTIAPQTVRLVAQSRGASRRLDDQGDVEAPDYVIVGMPDTDVQRGDTFEHDDRRWRIQSIQTSPPYAIRAEVVEHGLT